MDTHEEAALHNAHQACTDAGLDVMTGVMDVLWDRDNLPPAWFAALRPQQVAALYRLLAPALDEIEDCAASS